jgi:3-oxoacyl-[acyl-carrier protein] reductase
MSKLAKKVALVTGGCRGIGAKDASAASAVIKAIELGGGKAIAIQAPAANEGDWGKLLESFAHAAASWTGN